jgi:hypothetical protein
VARHEQAKRTIGTALATLEGVHVRLEPLVFGTQLRDDIRITGSASSGLGSEDIDITTVSLASQDFQTATLPLVTTEDDSAAQRIWFDRRELHCTRYSFNLTRARVSQQAPKCM